MALLQTVLYTCKVWLAIDRCLFCDVEQQSVYVESVSVVSILSDMYQIMSAYRIHKSSMSRLQASRGLLSSYLQSSSELLFVEEYLIGAVDQLVQSLSEQPVTRSALITMSLHWVYTAAYCCYHFAYLP